MDDKLFSVEGKTIVLTGACGLVGHSLATALVVRKASLVLVDVATAHPEVLAENLSGEALGISCDVSKSSSVNLLVRQTLERFGRVDVLINCHQYKPEGFCTAQAETFPEELWDAIVEVNLKGTFLTCRDFGQLMLGQGKGSIINFASTYGVVSSNPSLYENNSLGNPAAYSASKGGVITLTRYLAAHWARRGVRVNCVTPHGIYNGHDEAFIERFQRMSPMGRMMKVEEVVGTVLFLASDASSYATGSNVLIEGGWTAW
jgi:NAD(P)-dependent dehydrogenase (short-subunit alcohol dehydrogenase family)